MQCLQAASATGVVFSCLWPQELPFRTERRIEHLHRRPRAGLGSAGGRTGTRAARLPRGVVRWRAGAAPRRCGTAVAGEVWSAGAPARVGSGGQSRQQSAVCHGSAATPSRWRATRLVLGVPTRRRCVVIRRWVARATSCRHGTLSAPQSADRSARRGRAAPASCGAASNVCCPPVGSATWGTLPPPSAPQGAQRCAAGVARGTASACRGRSPRIHPRWGARHTPAV